MFVFVRRNSILAVALLILCFANCATNTNANATPAQTVANFVAAAKNKDAAAMKTFLSNGTLKLLEDNARAQNKTLDQVLAEDTNASLASKVAEAETRNEQINGETATLEIKNPQTGGWDKLYFQRENNQWKIAHDKMMQEMLNEAGETN